MVDRVQLTKDWFCLKTDGMYQEEVISFCHKEKIRIVQKDPLIIELYVPSSVCPELDEFPRLRYNGPVVEWL